MVKLRNTKHRSHISLHLISEWLPLRNGCPLHRRIVNISTTRYETETIRLRQVNRVRVEHRGCIPRTTVRMCLTDCITRLKVSECIKSKRKHWEWGRLKRWRSKIMCLVSRLWRKGWISSGSMVEIICTKWARSTWYSRTKSWFKPECKKTWMKTIYWTYTVLLSELEAAQFLTD